MNEPQSNKATLHALHFWREVIIYCLLGILPVLATIAAMLALSWWDGFYLLAVIVFVIGYATFRFGAFLGLNRRQWLAVIVLFLLAYIPSYVYLLYEARKYYIKPPPPPPRRKADDDPRYQPRGTSVVLDWSEPHGTGGGS
jgi:hypothetical protein